jgi:hypothetical protein
VDVTNRRGAMLMLLALLSSGACHGGAGAFPGGRLSPVPAAAPDRLIRESAAPPSGVATNDASPTCYSPMFDPRDNSALMLVASGSVDGVLEGDYAIPAGRYGVRDGALLRIDCRTGRVLALVNG